MDVQTDYKMNDKDACNPATKAATIAASLEGLNLSFNRQQFFSFYHEGASQTMNLIHRFSCVRSGLGLMFHALSLQIPVTT